MDKLKSFEQFVVARTTEATRELQEEQNQKRTESAETFKSLLAEFNVTSIKELSEEQRSAFFERLRGVEVNESFLLVEGTRGQFGKIDKKGNITSVYTHYDSYPEHMLPLIKKNYMKGEYEEVIAGGNSSGLESDPSKMNFYGEDDKLNGNVKDIKRYVRAAQSNWGAEYVYLYDEGAKKWMMIDVYGNGALVPAFESVVNEAIKVEGKRAAKKVVTQYTKILMNELNSIGASNDKKILLGAVKKLFMDAMEDANFHREKDACATAIKGNIGSVPVIVDGLGKMVVNIGATRIKAALEEHYSRISNAAGWSGQAIAEGTALFLEQIGFEKMGQDLLNKFNAQFEGETVRVDTNSKLYENFVAIEERENKLYEATVMMDAMDPDNKDFLKFLKKNRVKIVDRTEDGPAGFPEITMQGKRKDLEKVLADGEYGWDDPGLAEYIEESIEVNEGLHPKLKKAQKAIKKGETVYGENVRFPGRFKIIELGNMFATVDYEDGTKPMEMASMNIAIDSLQFESVEVNVNEAEVKSDEDFKEYAFSVLQKAFGEDFDEAKAQEVVDGLISKHGDDYGAMVGALQSSLG